MITLTTAVVNFDEMSLLGADTCSSFTWQIYLEAVWLRKAWYLLRLNSDNLETVHLLVNILGNGLRVLRFVYLLVFVVVVV